MHLYLGCLVEVNLFLRFILFSYIIAANGGSDDVVLMVCIMQNIQKIRFDSFVPSIQHPRESLFADRRAREAEKKGVDNHYELRHG